MAVRTPVYHPTPSQWASAATHLEQRSEWRTVRIDGTRYVVLVSGNSGRTYFVRADAAGCGCLWYAKTQEQCSHMLAVYLSATLDELAESTPVIERLRALYPPCAAGCGAITEGNLFCDTCSAARERAERLAAARRRVVEAWL